MDLLRNTIRFYGMYKFLRVNRKISLVPYSSSIVNKVSSIS